MRNSQANCKIHTNACAASAIVSVIASKPCKKSESHKAKHYTAHADTLSFIVCFSASMNPL